ncbi:cyclin-D3-3-like [Hibiscus syriacus]|uniref:cyclin-D3-3-like n=1 Tax=Hibiscus syriacus TaxID=106335 RepID=UPI0019239FF0|nr:cyclin-D3-3-like [Hibiscus syriacus]
MLENTVFGSLLPCSTPENRSTVWNPSHRRGRRSSSQVLPREGCCSSTLSSYEEEDVGSSMEGRKHEENGSSMEGIIEETLAPGENTVKPVNEASAWSMRLIALQLSTGHSTSIEEMEEAEYVFDSKTIQRMELLVLSTLQWRMKQVTPISFFDHITRRLGLKTHLHWEFLCRCERLLLFLITDSRFMLYVPSILAAATMLHVVKEVEPCHYLEYQKQLVGVLKICEDKVNACYELISELLERQYKGNLGNKRKHRSIPSSPSGVIDVSFSCDSSDGLWVVSCDIFSLFITTATVSQNRLFVDVLSSHR